MRRPVLALSAACASLLALGVLHRALGPASPPRPAALPGPSAPAPDEPAPPELRPPPAPRRAVSPEPAAASADAAAGIELPALRLRGRVLAAGTEVPLSGVAVAIAVPGRPETTVRTRAGGRFHHYAPELPPSASARAVAPRGYTAQPPLALDAAALSGRREVVLRLVAERSERLRGRVVDRHTLGPVAGASVALLGRSMPTDALGRFESAIALPPFLGERAEVTDAATGQRIAARELDHEPGLALELVVELGPTIQLDFPADHELDGWRARVVETAPGRSERRWGWVGVRAGPFPWLRYLRQSWLPDEDYAARVDVKHEALGLSGWAPLSATAGVHPGVVSVPLVGMAALTGRVALGDQPMPDAICVLAPLPGGRASTELEHWRELFPDAEGRFAYRGLEAGPYRLVVKSPLHEARVLSLDLPPGTTDLGAIAFPALPIAGDVEGRLVGSPDGPDPRALVRLRAVDGSLERWAMAGVAAGPGRRGGPARFAFTRLPAGPYELSAVPLEGRPFEPAVLLVSPPARELELARRDDLELAGHAFRLVDAETGEELPEGWLARAAGGRWLEHAARLRSGERAVALVAGEPLEWVVGAEGRAAVRGGPAAFAPGPGGGRLATVRLERGFGAALLVKDGDHLHEWPDAADHELVRSAACPGLGGATVLADSVPVATTDAGGLAVLALPEAPRLLEVRKAGWRYVGARGLDAGRLEDGQRLAVVFLARAE